MLDPTLYLSLVLAAGGILTIISLFDKDDDDNDGDGKIFFKGMELQSIRN